MNHDLTPADDVTAKKLRDFGRAAINDGKKVKFEYLNVLIDGCIYTYNPDTKFIITANHVSDMTVSNPAPKLSNNNSSDSSRYFSLTSSQQLSKNSTSSETEHTTLMQLVSNSPTGTLETPKIY